MISLYHGRLLLFCDRADRTWHCRVVLGPKAEHQLEADTGTILLQEALLRAQSVYAMAMANIRPNTEPRLCWDCVQWDTKRKRCSLEFPEARQSGGRYAERCEVFIGADDHLQN
jgi:hypothetical protein